MWISEEEEEGVARASLLKEDCIMLKIIGKGSVRFVKMRLMAAHFWFMAIWSDEGRKTSDFFSFFSFLTR